MSEPKIIRWGIVGTGVIARQFAGDIEHAAGARLAAVAARDPARARAFASDYADVTGFGSLTGMIRSGTIDAVYVATPNAVHGEQALECIAEGMPVLIEKPMTADLDQALEIQAAAQRTGVFVMEAMWSRYLPAIRAARQAIGSGAIGAIRLIEAELAWKVDHDPSHRLFDKAQGGGVLHDLGVYPISLTRLFLGEPDEVQGQWTRAPTGVDVSAELTMRYPQAVARLRCGFDRDGDNRMIIEGDGGVLVLGPLFIKATGLAIYPARAMADLLHPGGLALSDRLRRKLGAALPLPGIRRQALGFPGTGLQFEIAAASAAIRQGLDAEQDNSITDTIATLRIVDGILRQDPAKP